MTTYIGIDIAAKSFDMAYRREGRNSQVQRYQQTAQGFAQAIKRLRALKPSLVVMEATGVYYLDLAVALHEAGMPVAVINPKSFRHFATLKLCHSKTDGLDTVLLAEFGECLQPPRWTPPEPTCLALRDIARQINRLVGARTQAKNRLHALQSKRQTPALLIEDEQQGIDELERRIERLREAAQKLIAQNSELAPQLAAITAAKGLSTTSAITVLGELCVLPRFLKASQVTRHAGLDIRLAHSGTSVHRPARLSKAGNAYLRTGLYMPALSAIRHDEHARAFYQALLARGKTKLQAVCAVMRKYLTGLWACLRDLTPFDASKLFSEQHKQALT